MILLSNTVVECGYSRDMMGLQFLVYQDKYGWAIYCDDLTIKIVISP